MNEDSNEAAGEAEGLNFTVNLTLGEYISANLLYQRRYWLWSGLLKSFTLGTALGFIVLFAINALFARSGELDITKIALSSLLYGLAITIFVPVLSLIMMRFRVKRMFEQMDMALPMDFTANQTSFQVKGPQGTSNLDWDRLLDFVQDSKLVLLRRTRIIFFIVPKAQLSAPQLEGLLALLRGAGVKEG